MGRYVAYVAGSAIGALQCQWSEPLTAAPTTVTLRVRNNTGKTITLIAAQGFSETANNQVGTVLDIWANGATVLTAPINMQVSDQINAAGGIAPANNTVANGVDILFTLTNFNGGGATAMNDAQATVFYTEEFAST